LGVKLRVSRHVGSAFPIKGARCLRPVPTAAVTESFTFLAYTIPILGGIISDTKWGRFKISSSLKWPLKHVLMLYIYTIAIGTALGGIAHVLLVIPYVIW
jgi:POT family proton-dependent oligopeptide transporter